jgi:hypothetical protein
MAKKKTVDMLKWEREKLLKELSEAGEEWVVGSLVETTIKRNGKRIPFRYLSTSVRGRNKILYVAEHQMGRFQKAVAMGKKMEALIERIAELNAKIIKTETQGKSGLKSKSA